MCYVDHTSSTASYVDITQIKYPPRGGGGQLVFLARVVYSPPSPPSPAQRGKGQGLNHEGEGGGIDMGVWIALM